MSPLYRFLIYFFPFPLLVIEWLIRMSFGNTDTTAFVGPSLCSAALALLLPVIVPKSVPTPVPNFPADFMVPASYVIRKITDERVVAVGVILLLLGLSAWSACLYLSFGGALPSRLQMPLSAHDPGRWIGVILYFTVTAVTEWKERA
jgi:hypothetical protein